VFLWRLVVALKWVVDEGAKYGISKNISGEFGSVWDMKCIRFGRKRIG
jgi:hypothetical protein